MAGDVTFVASRQGKTLVIAAPRGFDAFEYARRVLGDEGLTLEPSTKPATVELRWIGNDAGQRPNLHAEVRTRARGRWTKWSSL